MATTLHEQLKEYYVPDKSAHEVDLDGFRIDAVDGSGRLIEVQCASLAAIRDKIKVLCDRHQITVVRPLARRKVLLKKKRQNGKVVSRRCSPVHETLPWIFLELVHFIGPFPHPHLTLDILLTEQEEVRVPPKRRTWRRRYRVLDRSLIRVEKTVSVRTADDLWQQLDLELPDRFTTADLARAGHMPRWLAQKAAWCFRRMQRIHPVGKQGNSIVYCDHSRDGAAARRNRPAA